MIGAEELKAQLRIGAKTPLFGLSRGATSRAPATIVGNSNDRRHHQQWRCHPVDPAGGIAGNGDRMIH
jgi:hypothetical protein